MKRKSRSQIQRRIRRHKLKAQGLEFRTLKDKRSGKRRVIPIQTGRHRPVLRSMSLKESYQTVGPEFLVRTKRDEVDREAWLRLAKFLGPAWAGKKVSVEEGGGHEFYATRDGIYLPDWKVRDDVASGLGDRDQFRIYRQGLWHESQHTKFLHILTLY